jgi:perosamine synthetase
VIPLSVPNIKGNELKYVNECLETGWISSAGEFVTKFESSFASWIGVNDAVSTMNGTAALHLALLIGGVKRGDIVIMPNITFVATANSISYVGANPVFIDIDPQSWQMDLDLLESFLNEDCTKSKTGELFHKETKKRIAAIMIVHVQGHMCNMHRLQEICKTFQIQLIEDAAEALGSTFSNQQAGTIGDLGCYSFNGNKIMSTGGGGMLVAKNDILLSNARHLATTAKTNPLTYFHDEVGFNYRLVNLLAAIGVAQLENLSQFLESKRSTAAFYTKALLNVGDITFQRSAAEVNPNHWLFTIKTSKMEKLLDYLNNHGVMSRPFWMPMTQLPMYKSFLYIHRNDISSEIHKSCLSIPCSTSITQRELETVSETICRFFN